MKKTTILILGGGVMQMPAIRLSRELGFSVIVADGNPSAPGAALADHFEHIDLKDRERMLTAARGYRERGRLDGVFTAGTDFSSTVAWVAEALGLPGIPVEAARRATDKGLMREAFRAAGVPSPDFVIAGPGFRTREILSTLRFPLVVKPVDNMGSRGVRRVETEDELDASVRRALELSRSSRVIIEEYIEGPEYSIDALVYEGEIYICGLADRHIFFPPFFVEMGHTIPTEAPERVQEHIREVFKRGVRAIGITCGAAKGDIRYSSRGPLIGEIAARLSGGYMSGWTYPYSSGVEVTAGALRIAVGLHPGDLTPKRHHVCAERAFISIPGTVASITGLDAARKVPRVRDLFLKAGTGSSVVFPANNVEKCGNIIAEAAERSEAIEAAESAGRLVRIRLAPSVEETRRFLFSRDEGYPPSAFRLSDPENLAAYESMDSCRMDGDVTGSAPGDTGVPLLPSVSIDPLPRLEAECSRDWQGRAFTDALREVLETTGCGLGSGGALTLSRLFWQAFLRGGAQGGIWLIDTVREELERGVFTTHRPAGTARMSPTPEGSPVPAAPGSHRVKP